MGKRRYALLLAALLCLAAAGCGKTPPPAGGEPPAVAAPPPAEETEVPAEQGADLLEAETLDGLRYGQTEAEVEALWGAPLERTEPEVWGADGLPHTQWTYDGASLSFGDGALETVRVTAPRPGQTLAGVGVGSTAEEVRAAYPDLIDEELSGGDRLVAGSAYGGLIFTLEDGVVTGVTLGATAE